jgi:hypothetical protein
MTTKRKQNTNEVTDQSSDRQYFIITPQLVWALCEDPYEYALWTTIKMISIEGKPLKITTENLAAVSMMSLGKVHQCRKRLIDIGLLSGEMQNDLENPQPVWRLTIPDLWRANAEWSQEHNTLRKKIDFKKIQRAKLKESRKSLRELKDLQSLKNEYKDTTLQENDALLFGKENQLLPPEPAFHQVKMVAEAFSYGENGSAPYENGSASHENGSTPRENSLYIQDPYQDPELNPDQDPSTTTILGNARANFPVNGGGGEGHITTDQIEDTSPPLEGPAELTTRDTSALSPRTKILAMRSMAATIIDGLPTRWWGKDEFILALAPQPLYELCAWLWLWHITHQEIRTGGLLDEAYFERIAEKERAEKSYGQLWVGINNVPAIIKSRLTEAIAPLDDDDRARLNNQLLDIARAIQEELNKETAPIDALATVRS